MTTLQTTTTAQLVDENTAARLRAALETAAQLHEDGGHRENTRRAYRADWACFTGWCASVGVEALPAVPGVVAAYVGHLVNEGRAVSTIRRRLAGIAHHHREAGHATPTTHDDVRRVVRGLEDNRTAARRGRGKAAALTASEVLSMARTCAHDTRGALERAVVLVGYAAALRRGEFGLLDVSDVALSTWGARLELRGTKTTRAADTAVVEIKRTGGDDCPVAALEAWLALSGVTSGALFRGVDNGGNVGGRLAGRTVARIVQRAARRAGIENSKVRGHTLRRSHVTVRDQAGEDHETIRSTTRHRSTRSFMGYTDANHTRRAAERAVSSLYT